MTPLERAARALCTDRDPGDTSGGPHPSGTWIEKGEAWWTGYVDQARAVLEAIREPSEGMVKEGAYQIPCGQGVEEGPPNASDAKDCWQAMIDAALSEKPE